MAQKTEEIVNKDVLTEQEVNLLKRRLNDKKITHEDIFGEDGKVFKLTPEQTKKGLDWLMDKWKTPRGIERKNNPFGYREQEILENFDHFELGDFYNSGNAYVDFYVPYYTVVSKDGNSFEYCVYGGEIHILG